MIEVEKYNNNIEDWDFFVEKSDNGTLFQKQRFLSYHISRNFQDASYLFKKRNKIIAIFPASIENQGSKKVLFSHPGSSFGGIVHGNLSFKECNLIIDYIDKIAKEEGCDEIIIIQTPVIYNKNNELVNYCLSQKNYTNQENYLSSILRVEENVNEQLKNIARNKNRSQNYYNSLISKNMLKFKWVSDFNDFYPILIKNKDRHNAKPTHSLKELERLKSLFPDNVLQLMLYNEKEALGGITIFKTNQKSAVLFYSMFDYKYNQLQPIALLIQHILIWAKKEQLEFIDYGVSHLPDAENPLTPNSSLIKFKEEFGCIASIRNVYKKILND